MEDDSSGRLLQHLRTGSEEALAEVFDLFGTRLYRAARGMSTSAVEAEDAVQEVFLGLVRARRILAGVDNLPAYLFSALRNAAGRIIAQRRRHEHLARTPHRDHSSAESIRTEHDDLERALAQLSKPQRQVIALKIYGGLTFAETAEVLGVSANTAASRYRYALARLRMLLKESAR